MFSSKFIKLIVLFIIPLISLNSCNGKLPGGDARKYPADPKKRIEQNIAEGKSFKLFDNVENLKVELLILQVQMNYGEPLWM
jgi:hypothetical protein